MSGLCRFDGCTEPARLRGRYCAEHAARAKQDLSNRRTQRWRQRRAEADLDYSRDRVRVRLSDETGRIVEDIFVVGVADEDSLRCRLEALARQHHRAVCQGHRILHTGICPECKLVADVRLRRECARLVRTNGDALQMVAA